MLKSLWGSYPPETATNLPLLKNFPLTSLYQAVRVGSFKVGAKKAWRTQQAQEIKLFLAGMEGAVVVSRSSGLLGRVWLRRLRNAAAWARLHVLACLRGGGCRGIVGRGAAGDMTKEFDVVAEQAVTGHLGRFASFILLSEEEGMQKIGSSPEGYVILDPIDGSNNISHGLPLACISLAFGLRPVFGALEAGVVMEVFSGRCFYAVRGLGAWLDGRRIRPGPPRPFPECLVGVDIEYPSESTPRVSESKIVHVRHLGANALELCYVAEGIYDAFVDLRGTFRGTDLAAAALILREAGAILLDGRGEPLHGECTNEATYALVAARSLSLARSLIQLSRGKRIEPGASPLVANHL